MPHNPIVSREEWLVARSDQDEARYLDIDLDLRRGPEGLRFTDKQGRPY